MWNEFIINGEYRINNAKEAEEYYIECIRRKIDNKIKQACENERNSCDVKKINKDIQKELEDLGYEVINTMENTIIKW